MNGLALQLCGLIGMQLLIAGCGGGSDFTAFDEASAELRAKMAPRHDSHRTENVTVGEPSLLAGIPGVGPVKLAEIDAFLGDAANHRPLQPRLPWGGDEAAALIHIPPDNELTRAKIELGRQLFFDRRLSNPKLLFACADCHHPRDHFQHPGHGLDRSAGFGRSVPVTVNRILGKSHYWDGRAGTLEEQALEPLANPNEMDTTPEDCVRRLSMIPGYRRQFHVLFGELSPDALAKALASFLRAVVTAPADFDKEPHLLKPAERGRVLFFGKAKCSQCHSGPNFTDESFHNIGVGLDELRLDEGRFRVTKEPANRGRFKTPTLRNIARTSPYMHRGQFIRLEEVIEWYDRGGGANENLDPLISPLGLSAKEKSDLVAFLQSLTADVPPMQTGRLPE